MTTILYHVTPTANRMSILNIGIQPSFSTGKRAVSWFVTPSALDWALAHISEKRKIAVSELTVFLVHVSLQEMTRTRWKNVYVSSKPIGVSGLLNVKAYLNSPDGVKEALE